MSIKKCCENCYHFEHSKTGDLCYYCKNQNFWNYQPKEELIRADEKSKLIKMLKEDYKTAKINYEGYKDANYDKGFWAGQMAFARNLIGILKGEINEIKRTNNKI